MMVMYTTKTKFLELQSQTKEGTKESLWVGICGLPKYFIFKRSI